MSFLRPQNRNCASHGPDRERGQGGATLLEVAIAVMLIGMGLLSVISLLYGVLVSSSIHQEKVRVGNRATELAEQIDDMIYIPCDGADEGSLYESALDVGSGALYWEQIEEVRFLADADQAVPVWSDSCPTTDQGAQEVTVSVKSKARGTVVTDLVFVKRDTNCPEGIVGRKC